MQHVPAGSSPEPDGPVASTSKAARPATPTRRLSLSASFKKGKLQAVSTAVVTAEAWEPRLNELWDDASAPEQWRLRFTQQHAGKGLGLNSDAIRAEIKRVEAELARRSGVDSLIAQREENLQQAYELVQALLAERPDRSAEERRALRKQLAEALVANQRVSVEAVEAIVQWRDGEETDERGEPRAYMWGGVNYLLKMQGDLDFVHKLDPAVRGAAPLFASSRARSGSVSRPGTASGARPGTSSSGAGGRPSLAGALRPSSRAGVRQAAASHEEAPPERPESSLGHYYSQAAAGGGGGEEASEGAARVAAAERAVLEEAERDHRRKLLEAHEAAAGERAGRQQQQQLQLQQAGGEEIVRLPLVNRSRLLIKREIEFFSNIPIDPREAATQPAALERARRRLAARRIQRSFRAYLRRRARAERAAAVLQAAFRARRARRELARRQRAARDRKGTAQSVIAAAVRRRRAWRELRRLRAGALAAERRRRDAEEEERRRREKEEADRRFQERQAALQAEQARRIESVVKSAYVSVETAVIARVAEQVTQWRRFQALQNVKHAVVGSAINRLVPWVAWRNEVTSPNYEPAQTSRDYPDPRPPVPEPGQVVRRHAGDRGERARAPGSRGGVRESASSSVLIMDERPPSSSGAAAHGHHSHRSSAHAGPPRSPSGRRPSSQAGRAPSSSVSASSSARPPSPANAAANRPPSQDKARPPSQKGRPAPAPGSMPVRLR
eukprot:tig00000361_g24386.t1